MGKPGLFIALTVSCLATLGLFLYKPPLHPEDDIDTSTLKLRPQKDHPVTKEMESVAAKLSESQAPTFELLTPYGISVSSKQLCADRPLLVFFIEQDCPCCVTAKDFVYKIAEAYRSDLSVVGIINTDAKGAELWRSKVKPGFTILVDPKMETIQSFKADRGVYTTLVAPGGKIEKAYAGYSKSMLQDLVTRIALLAKVPKQSLEFQTAPDKMTSGCLFSVPETLTKS